EVVSPDVLAGCAINEVAVINSVGGAVGGGDSRTTVVGSPSNRRFSSLTTSSSIFCCSSTLLTCSRNAMFSVLTAATSLVISPASTSGDWAYPAAAKPIMSAAVKTQDLRMISMAEVLHCYCPADDV